MKLNLGCGEDYMKGCINVDFRKEVKADRHFDLEKRFPFKDNTFEEIFIYHTLEHIKDVIKFMDEVYRVAKNNCVVRIRTPHFSVCWSYGNPTHYQHFSLDVFEHFDKDYDEHYGKGDFKVCGRELVWNAKHEFLSAPFNILASLSYLVGGFDEISIDLEVNKNG